MNDQVLVFSSLHHLAFLELSSVIPREAGSELSANIKVCVLCSAHPAFDHRPALKAGQEAVELLLPVKVGRNR